jgi:hypothetical protein
LARRLTDALTQALRIAHRLAIDTQHTVTGAQAGYPLIKHCMNQGHDVIEFINGNTELKPADQEKLTKAVAKVTDGATLSELYQDMGIVKKPQGSGAKGGKITKPEEKDKPLTPAEQAAAEAEGRRLRVTTLITTLTEALADAPWNAGTKDQREELHGLLVDTATAVAATLKK